LFVSRQQDYAKTTQPIFRAKFGGEATLRPRKKPLDFGGTGNPGHVMLGLG